MSTIVTSGTPDGPNQPWVDVPPTAQTLETVVRFLTNWLVQNDQLPAHELDSVVGRILKREQLGSTGIGRGLAIPHATSEAITEPIFVAGLLSVPVDWASVDDCFVQKVVLLVGPGADRRAALAAVEAVARRLRGTSEFSPPFFACCPRRRRLY